MGALNEPVAKRIAKMFRLLGSNYDGEVLNAVAAMKRLFAAEELTFHDIATVIENANGEIEQLKYCDSDAETIFNRGVEKGRAESCGQIAIGRLFRRGRRAALGGNGEVLPEQSGLHQSQTQRTGIHRRAANQTSLARAEPAHGRIFAVDLLETAGIPAMRHTFGDPTKLPPALLPLTRQRRWVIWKWEQRGNGKWTKPPYQPCFYNELAATDNPTTWGTYAEAVLALTAGHCDGIGFMLKGSELAAIDLDHIRDFATGQVLRWVEELFVEAANAGCYLEWTVSGTGARIIGITGGGELHKKINVNRKTGCAVEFYRDCARYITISGFQISGDYPGLPVPTTLAQCDRLFDAILARFCDNTRRPTPEQCQFIPGLHVSIEEIPEDENEAGAPASSFNFDFNNAGPQGGEAAYQDLIENGAPQGERSEEFQRVVWHLAAQGKSAEEIAEELAQHPSGIGAKYAGRLLPEVQRSYRKWQAHRQATAMGAAPCVDRSCRERASCRCTRGGSLAADPGGRKRAAAGDQRGRSRHCCCMAPRSTSAAA